MNLLQALEKSGSAVFSTGWQPFHYIQINNKKKIVVVCPLYVKSHSFGEYIFDHAWADAYHRYGLALLSKTYNLQSPLLLLLVKELSYTKF